MTHSCRWKYLRLALCALAIVLGGAPRAWAAPVVATVPVGANPFGVGVNSTTNRVYVVNFSDDTVSVINGADNTVLATVAVQDQPAEAAVNESTNRIYVTNQASSTVSVIDGATNTVLTNVVVGSFPLDLAVDAASNRIFVVNQGANTVSVIDGATNTVIVPSIPTGSVPFGIAVNSGTSRAYVTNINDNTVTVIDTTTNMVIATIAVGVTPAGVVVATGTNRVYVANLSSDTVSVIDGATNTVVATIPVGDGPNGIDINTSTNRLYVANQGDPDPGNTLSVIDAALNTVIGTVMVGNDPRRVAINSATNLVYNTNLQSNTVSVILDSFATLRFSTANISLSEDEGTVSIPVFRFGNTSSAVSVNFTTTDGTATTPGDFTSTSGSVTFAPGQTTASASVPISFSAASEGAESFTVTLSSPTATQSDLVQLGTPATVTVTITDGAAAGGRVPDVTTFALTVSNRLLAFSAQTPGTIQRAVTISGLSAGENILGIDFRPANGVLYGLSSASRLFTIDTASGAATLVGAGGAFALNGSEFGFDFNPVPDRIRVTSDTRQNLRLNPNSGALALNDGTLTYAAGDVNQGASPVAVGAAYTNPDNDPATGTTLYDIDVRTSALVIQDPPNSGTLSTVGPLGLDASALVGFDISTGNTALAAISRPGDASRLFTISLSTGRAREVGRIEAGGEAIRGLAIALPGTIGLGIAEATVAEGAGLARVTISRLGAGAGSVDFSVTGGTATLGGDFSDVSGRLSFAPGELSRTVLIPIANDTLTESNETFTVTLSNPSNATLAGPSVQTITITDDDFRSVTVAGTSVSEGDRGTTQAVFTVTLSAASSLPVTVDFSASASSTPNSATATGDFAPTSGTLTFAPGETSKPVAVTVQGDTLAEGNETFGFTLSNPTNAFLTMQGFFVSGTILDDDAPALAISVAPSTFSESAGANAATATVSRNTQDNTAALTVSLASSDTNSATVPATVTIPAGADRAMFSVAAVDDLVVDGSKNLSISASAPGFAPDAEPVTVTDNESPQLSLSIMPSTFAEGASASATVTRNTSTSGALVVTLSSSDTSEATVPATATIAAGASSATFPVTGVVDGVVDGAQDAVISASATGLATAQARVLITDATPPPTPTPTPTSTPTATPTPTATATPTATPAPNAAPVGQGDFYSTSGRVIRVGAPGVLSNDRDAEGSALSANLLRVPAHGTLQFSRNGAFTYTAAPVYQGTDTFVYAPSDGLREGSPVTVTLRVGAARDITRPFISLRGGALRRETQLTEISGQAADVYIVAGRGIVASSGLRSVVVRLQRSDGQYFNGRAFQRAVFELPTVMSGRVFLVLPGSLPVGPTVSTRYLITAIARDNAGNASKAQQSVLIASMAPRS